MGKLKTWIWSIVAQSTGTNCDNMREWPSKLLLFKHWLNIRSPPFSFSSSNLSVCTPSLSNNGKMSRRKKGRRRDEGYNGQWKWESTGGTGKWTMQMITVVNCHRSDEWVTRIGSWMGLFRRFSKSNFEGREKMKELGQTRLSSSRLDSLLAFFAEFSSEIHSVILDMKLGGGTRVREFSHASLSAKVRNMGVANSVALRNT